MKLASCDFCPKTKAKPRGDCLTTNIDGRVYDICPDCKAARDVQLQGKGTAVAQSGTLTLRMGTLYNTNSTALPAYGIRPNPWAYNATGNYDN